MYTIWTTSKPWKYGSETKKPRDVRKKKKYRVPSRPTGSWGPTAMRRWAYAVGVTYLVPEKQVSLTELELFNVVFFHERHPHHVQTRENPTATGIFLIAYRTAATLDLRKFKNAYVRPTGANASTSGVRTRVKMRSLPGKHVRRAAFCDPLMYTVCPIE